MKKVNIFFITFLVAFVFISFKNKENEKVHWMSMEEMQLAYKKKPKPIIVDVYTSWCGWCKVMDKETYSNDQVAAYINEKYYAVKLDAEGKDPIEWNGKKYGYIPQHKVNELAAYFLNGQMGYPTTVFFSSLDANPAPLAGYLKPKEIESPLKYFGDGVFKTKPYPEFMKSFGNSWK